MPISLYRREEKLEFLLTRSKIQRFVALGGPLNRRYLRDVIAGQVKGIARKRRPVSIVLAKKLQKTLAMEEANQIMPESAPAKPSLEAMLDFFQKELKAGHLKIIPPAEAALRLQKDKAALRESITSISHLPTKEQAADNGPSLGS